MKLPPNQNNMLWTGKVLQIVWMRKAMPCQGMIVEAHQAITRSMWCTEEKSILATCLLTVCHDMHSISDVDKIRPPIAIRRLKRPIGTGGTRSQTIRFWNPLCSGWSHCTGHCQDSYAMSTSCGTTEWFGFYALSLNRVLSTGADMSRDWVRHTKPAIAIYIEKYIKR